MMARHWAGSSNLILLLHGFGHCVSHPTVLQYDTAIASMELSKNSIVRVGFHSKVHTTVVWDNNDFLEETISGTGTTHNTNSIIVHWISKDN